MSCVATNPEGASPTSCRVAYGVIVAGTVVALVGAFEPQLSGGAYVLMWSRFMAGLLPYLAVGVFLPMHNTVWLAVTGVIVLLADVALRLGSGPAGTPPWGGYAPLVLAVIAAIALGAGSLLHRGRAEPAAGTAPAEKPEPRAGDAEE